MRDFGLTGRLLVKNELRRPFVKRAAEVKARREALNELPQRKTRGDGSEYERATRTVEWCEWRTCMRSSLVLLAGALNQREKVNAR